MEPKQFSLKPLIAHYKVSRPINWAEHFECEHPLIVEIGSGLGDFLVRTAYLNPSDNFVGIEREAKWIQGTLRKIARLNLENVRVLHIDAWVAFERLFFPLTIHRVFCLFPCPWPKKRHIRHRLFSSECLQLINSRLLEGGELKIITDHSSYFEWILEQTSCSGFKEKTRIVKPQFNTKYECKWHKQGQQDFFELQLVKEQHCNISLTEDVELKSFLAEDFIPARFSMDNEIGERSIIFKEFLFPEFDTF